MPLIVSVHLLPTLAEPAELVGSTVVVIDVLRATTTITTALANGAVGVVPCLDVDDAQHRKTNSNGPILLGGERQGVRIEGFDLGNSPKEYTSEVVEGKTILFTTTNGTRALSVCQQAETVLVAGFVNLQAVVSRLANTSPLHILCAGTNGQISQEDTLLAGALVESLGKQSGEPVSGNDQAKLARQAWSSLPAGEESLENLLRGGSGGKNLLKLGLEEDIRFCATLDIYDLVPSLNRQSGTIRRE